MRGSWGSFPDRLRPFSPSHFVRDQPGDSPLPSKLSRQICGASSEVRNLRSAAAGRPPAAVESSATQQSPPEQHAQKNRCGHGYTSPVHVEKQTQRSPPTAPGHLRNRSSDDFFSGHLQFAPSPHSSRRFPVTNHGSGDTRDHASTASSIWCGSTKFKTLKPRRHYWQTS